MTQTSAQGPSTKRIRPRVPLTRELVLQTALRLADQGGLESLSMRKLGQELGVEAMALYYHFANKDEVLDGIVDLVWAEIDLPVAGDAWRTAMRRRAISVRDVLARHRWAIGLMESRRNPGPANLRHHDAVIGNLRAAGFEMAMVAHAYSLMDGYIYGYALTKMNLPFDATNDITEMAQSMLEPFPEGEYPNMVAFITEHAMKPGYDFANEFEWGLDVLLDGIEREQTGPSAAPNGSDC
jgi:AcrR family transcriptional regulator